MQDLTCYNSNLDIIYKSGNSNDYIAYKNGYVIRHSSSGNAYGYFDYATRNPSVYTENNQFKIFFNTSLTNDGKYSSKIEVWREYADCPNNVANEFIKLLDVKDVADDKPKDILLESPELGLFKGIENISFKSNIFAFYHDGIANYKKSPDLFITKKCSYGYSLRLMADVGAGYPLTLLMTPNFNCDQPIEVWNSYYKYLYKNFINLISL